MDLWIRSQDKETLIKIDRLDVDGNKIQANFKSHFSGCDYVILGTYESNDRALEVLDEINEIKYYKYMAQLDWVSFANGVLKEKPMEEQKIIMSMMNTYNMPKE